MAAILAGSARNHGPPPTIFRTHRPDPNHGRGLIRFGQFAVSPSEIVNWSRNAELLFAVMVKNRVSWQVDGLTTISAGSSSNHGQMPAIFQTHHPDPNRGSVLIRFGQFSLSASASGNFARNSELHFAIRLKKECRMASRWIGRIFL